MSLALGRAALDVAPGEPQIRQAAVHIGEQDVRWELRPPPSSGAPGAPPAALCAGELRQGPPPVAACRRRRGLPLSRRAGARLAGMATSDATSSASRRWLSSSRPRLEVGRQGRPAAARLAWCSGWGGAVRGRSRRQQQGRPPRARARTSNNGRAELRCASASDGGWAELPRARSRGDRAEPPRSRLRRWRPGGAPPHSWRRPSGAPRALAAAGETPPRSPMRGAGAGWRRCKEKRRRQHMRLLSHSRLAVLPLGHDCMRIGEDRRRKEEERRTKKGNCDFVTNRAHLSRPRNSQNVTESRRNSVSSKKVFLDGTGDRTNFFVAYVELQTFIMVYMEKTRKRMARVGTTPCRAALEIAI